jgi:hypothetical protein
MTWKAPGPVGGRALMPEVGIPIQAVLPDFIISSQPAAVMRLSGPARKIHQEALRAWNGREVKTLPPAMSRRSALEEAEMGPHDDHN